MNIFFGRKTQKMMKEVGKKLSLGSFQHLLKDLNVRKKIHKQSYKRHFLKKTEAKIAFFFLFLCVAATYIKGLGGNAGHRCWQRISVWMTTRLDRNREVYVCVGCVHIILL